jgi:hypothetical protein
MMLVGAMAGCGSSTTGPAEATVTPTSAIPTSAKTSPTPTPTAPGSALATGAKSANCVNGWIQPAPGSDFYRQAQSALQDVLKAQYRLSAVRYFAGPLVAGGIGAVYYLDVDDPKLPVRLLIVSGAGPAHVAAAPSGTHGWKEGDWTGFGGTEPPAVHPPLPGTWAGPAFDPVAGGAALLSPSLTGCMAGT